MWVTRQAKLAAGAHEAALMHAVLPPAVLAAAENAWRQQQADQDPMKVCDTAPPCFVYVKSSCLESVPVLSVPLTVALE